VQIHARQIDTELRAAQRHDELAGGWASLDAQLTKQYRHKAVPETEWTTTINFTKARARAKSITATINYEGLPHPTFARASQNVALVAALLDTLPAPSIDRVDKVYYQLKDILGIATA
jgi:hypothetical protein